MPHLNCVCQPAPPMPLPCPIRLKRHRYSNKSHRGRTHQHTTSPAKSQIQDPTFSANDGKFPQCHWRCANARKRGPTSRPIRENGPASGRRGFGSGRYCVDSTCAARNAGGGPDATIRQSPEHVATKAKRCQRKKRVLYPSPDGNHNKLSLPTLPYWWDPECRSREGCLIGSADPSGNTSHIPGG